jgi:hypothetical protein
MLIVYADGDEPWRRRQQQDFAAALRGAGVASVPVKMIPGRSHMTVWTEMGRDEETSRAILEFTGSLARRTSSRSR